MIVDDAVDILQSYDDPSLRDEVITTLEEAHIIKDIIKYDDDTVGAYISNDYVSINPRMDVKKHPLVSLSKPQKLKLLTYYL